MRSLSMVRTRLGFVQVFLNTPRWSGAKWKGILLHPFSPRDARVLAVYPYLAPGVPRRWVLHETPQGQPWRFVREERDDQPVLTIYRVTCFGLWRRHIITFCDDALTASGLFDSPVGTTLYPSFT